MPVEPRGVAPEGGTSPELPDRPLRLGLSPCPNDTFLFHALLARRGLRSDLQFKPFFEDVETLNRMAMSRQLDVTKFSFGAYGAIRSRYRLLRSGAALGRGCGPLLVTRPEGATRPLPECRIAIPGRWTSATLLLRLYAPEVPQHRLVEMPFDRILSSVRDAEVEAGAIIHESRFTYHEHGLLCRVDLGQWWEEVHRHPIPLGGIAVARDLGETTFRAVETALRQSVRHARAHPEESREFVREHAQELSDEVTRAHIELYVNDFTVDLGVGGLRAVAHLLRLAEREGVLPRGG